MSEFLTLGLRLKLTIAGTGLLIFIGQDFKVLHSIAII